MSDKYAGVVVGDTKLNLAYDTINGNAAYLTSPSDSRSVVTGFVVTPIPEGANGTGDVALEAGSSSPAGFTINVGNDNGVSGVAYATTPGSFDSDGPAARCGWYENWGTLPGQKSFFPLTYLPLYYSFTSSMTFAPGDGIFLPEGTVDGVLIFGLRRAAFPTSLNADGIRNGYVDLSVFWEE